MLILGASVASVVATVLLLGSTGCGSDGGGGAKPEGRQISRRAGCASCHGADGEGGIGPAWAGSLGTEIELTDGTTVTVDEAYLTSSIAEPSAQVRAGYTVAMPENQLSDEEIAEVVDYIVWLNGGPESAEAVPRGP